MFNSKPAETSRNLIDQVAQSADSAIHTTQRVVNETMDGLGDQASALVHHGMDSVRKTSRQIREGAHHTSDKTVAYIREEPVKSMLIAAATGAALMALARVISQSNHSR